MDLYTLSPSERTLRLQKIIDNMRAADMHAMLAVTSTSLFYLTGRVFLGYILIDAASGTATPFVMRPAEMEGDDIVYIRKPEQIADHTTLPPHNIGLELNALPYNEVMRLAAAFGNPRIADASPLLARARAVKTPAEIEMIRQCGIKHDRVYRLIPKLYREGMSDIEFQVEIERVMRQEGCLGQLRVNGRSMEIHMGSLLVGDNADTPSPYDFSMGGAGIDPSLPVGADGTIIRPGNSVMADMNGDFNGYMTDMTRTFSLGALSPQAIAAHETSVRICDTLARAARPGMECRELYDMTLAIVKEAHLEPYFMGHRYHAKFIGHGVGIEINELPVITPKSHALLEAGNVIALEPKFVIPGTGAVGIENTYLLTPDRGLQSFNNAPTEIISLDR